MHPVGPSLGAPAWAVWMRASSVESVPITDWCFGRQNSQTKTLRIIIPGMVLSAQYIYINPPNKLWGRCYHCSHSIHGELWPGVTKWRVATQSKSCRMDLNWGICELLSPIAHSCFSGRENFGVFKTFIISDNSNHFQAFVWLHNLANINHIWGDQVPRL